MNMTKKSPTSKYLLYKITLSGFFRTKLSLNCHATCFIIVHIPVGAATYLNHSMLRMSYIQLSLICHVSIPRPLRRHLVTSLQPLSSAATAKGATPGGSGWLHTVDGSEIWLTSWGKGSLSNYLQGLIHPRWCRISSINSWSRTGCEKNKICFWHPRNPEIGSNNLK